MDQFLGHLPMAIALVLVAIIFKNPLVSWINRFGRVKTGDTTFEMLPQVEQQANDSNGSQLSGKTLVNNAEVRSGTADIAEIQNNAFPTGTVTNQNRANVLRSVGISPIIIEREAAIRVDLQNLPPNEQTDILIRNLAVAQSRALAEQIYRLIFGSQLEALNHLHLYGPLPKATLKELFYDTAAEQFVEAYKNYSSTAWFKYLESNNLIVVNELDVASLSVAGKAFLEWIVAAGILPKKPF